MDKDLEPFIERYPTYLEALDLIKLLTNRWEKLKKWAYNNDGFTFAKMKELEKKSNKD